MASLPPLTALSEVAAHLIDPKDEVIRRAKHRRSKQSPCDRLPWSNTRAAFFTKAKSSLPAKLPLMYHLADGCNQWADQDFVWFTGILGDTVAAMFIQARATKKPVSSEATNADIDVRSAEERLSLRDAAKRAGVLVVNGRVVNPPQRIVFTRLPDDAPTFRITFEW